MAAIWKIASCGSNQAMVWMQSRFQTAPHEAYVSEVAMGATQPAEEQLATCPIFPKPPLTWEVGGCHGFPWLKEVVGRRC